jgi:tripeptide aminopeptidase
MSSASGRGRTLTPTLVFSAHLDTVFPAGTDTTVKREGKWLKAPGIADDCRGLAVMLAVLGALNEKALATEGTVVFVGTVGEEGLGDLRGVRHLFEKEMKGKITHFISLDGSGLRVVSGAVGSHRYRVTFRAPGGHSYGMFGLVNPIHALGRAIEKDLAARGPGNAEDDLQCRSDRRRHLGQFDRPICFV